MNIEEIFESKVAEGSDINQHLRTLRDYAAQCGHVTEFGVRGANSTWALLAARPKRLVSYDIGWCENVREVERVAAEIGVSFQFIQADVRHVVIEPTDMLFIDTLHTYPQLKAELYRHGSQVSKFIALHDTETWGTLGENGERGLLPAMWEFLEAHPEWGIHAHFSNNNGLTILKHL